MKKLSPKRLALLIVLGVSGCILLGLIRSTLGWLEVLVILLVTIVLLLGIIFGSVR